MGSVVPVSSRGTSISKTACLAERRSLQCFPSEESRQSIEQEETRAGLLCGCALMLDERSAHDISSEHKNVKGIFTKVGRCCFTRETLTMCLEQCDVTAVRFVLEKAVSSDCICMEAHLGRGRYKLSSFLLLTFIPLIAQMGGRLVVEFQSKNINREGRSRIVSVH